MASGKSAGSKMVFWGIFGLLIVGLGGFGTANFGNGTSHVGSVGDQDIPLRDYANALQTQVRSLEAQTGQQMTVQQALEFGLSQQVLSQLISQTALDGEAANLGISVGDDAVRRELLSIDAFRGLDGKFNTDTYRQTLARTNMDDKDFESGLRKEAARGILTGALATGLTMPPSYGQVVVEWLGERRTVLVAELTPDALETGVPIASESDVQSWYDAHPDLYTAPETRAITYAWVSPTMLTDEVTLDEDALRELYDENISAYIQPERRLVERLVFASHEEAEAAAGRIATGDSSFEDEVNARGLNLIDTDMGDVTRDTLSDDAADAVFGLEGTGVVGPVDSDLGPALLRVNGTLEGTNISFEEARDDLAIEMSADAGARLIADQIEDFDDLLASGATLEELATETSMELGTLNWTPESDDDIAAYKAFRDAALAAQTGDFPEIVELSDGGIFALRLDEIIPPALRPLDEVRDQVAADWEANAIRNALSKRADVIESNVAAGQAITELGLPAQTFTEITRQDFISSMPRGFIDAVFAPGLALGGTTTIAGRNRVVIAKIERIDTPEESDENTAIAEGYITSAAQGAAQDAITAFANAIRTREGVTINQSALNAVHSRLK